MVVLLHRNVRSFPTILLNGLQCAYPPIITNDVSNTPPTGASHNICGAYLPQVPVCLVILYANAMRFLTTLFSDTTRCMPASS